MTPNQRERLTCTGGVGLGLAAGTGDGALGVSSIIRRASSCSCLSLVCRRARSSSALFLSSSSFCLAMFSKRALMLPVLLPAENQRWQAANDVRSCDPIGVDADAETTNKQKPTSLHRFGLLIRGSWFFHFLKCPSALFTRNTDVRHESVKSKSNYKHKHTLPCPSGPFAHQTFLQIL